MNETAMSSALITRRTEQRVMIDGHLTYLWTYDPIDDEPLTVGDKVMLPQNWLSEIKYGRGPILGTVTRLGSTYKGDLSPVLRRATDADLEEWRVDEVAPTGPKPMHPDPAHRHEVRWIYNAREAELGSYVSIDVTLGCGCQIHDIRAFAADMRAQKGWVVATTVGWAGWSGPTYTVRARRNSLWKTP